MTESAIERGAKRLRNFRAHYRKHVGKELAGRILDFGCGAGEFLLAALDGGFDAHGIEVCPERQTQFLHLTRDRPDVVPRFQLYDGRHLPYETGFRCVYSWFVFEHVPDTWQALREIARVLERGGVVAIYAEDARSAYEGHTRIPWPPFMPREFAAAYLEMFDLVDRTQFVQNDCFYITAPQITSVLASLGFEILYESATPPMYFPESANIRSEADARRAAAELMARRTDGRWKPPAENLTIFARKR